MNGFWQLAIAQLWQVTAVILIVAALVRLFARQRPYLAHALWLVVLLKCITPPLLSSPSGVFCWLQVSSAESSIGESGGHHFDLGSSETDAEIQSEANHQQESGESKAKLLVHQHEWQEPIHAEPRDQPEFSLAHVTIDKGAAVASDLSLPTESESTTDKKTPVKNPVTQEQENWLSPNGRGLFALTVCWLFGNCRACDCGRSPVVSLPLCA